MEQWLWPAKYPSRLTQHQNNLKMPFGRDRFLHLRTKFGKTYIEEIRHPVDERRHDVFMVVAEVPVETVPEKDRITDDSFNGFIEERLRQA